MPHLEGKHAKVAHFCTPCVNHVGGRNVCRFGRVSGILWKITAISADPPIYFSSFSLSCARKWFYRKVSKN